MVAGRAVIFGAFRAVPADMEDEWNRWYETQHLRVRLPLPGFIAARRFLAYEGECRYVTVYELESPEAVTSDAYRELKRRENALPATSFEARTLALPGFARGVYRQV